MADQWLSIVEYARTFKVSDMTVRRRIKTGRLHAVLKEGKYFIPVPVGDVRGNDEASTRPAGAANGSSKRSGEMTVIKGHPSAYRTIAAAEQTTAQTPQFAMAATAYTAPRPEPMHVATPHATAYADVPSEFIPESLRRPMLGSESSLVDTRALLAYCEASLRKFQEGERRVIERFKSKLETLEATLAGRDQEIKALRQQLEDLQVLVQILEKKR